MAKTAKATKVSRCRVCHREMTDPAHIAAGIGPICASKAARQVAVTASRVTYPRERYERITRSLEKLVGMIGDAAEFRSAAYRYGTREQQAQGEWEYSLIHHWCERWRRMQWRAYRLMQGMRAA